MDFGNEIFGVEKKVLQERIESRINPNNLNGLRFFENNLKVISKDFLVDKLLHYNYSSFIVVFTRGNIENVYDTPMKNLLHILEDRVIPNRRQGLDLTILSHDFLHAFMLNHDGGVFSIIVDEI